MLQEVKELQDNAGRYFLEVAKSWSSKEYTFKASTGSGKTFMMADFCNRILKERDGVIFLIFLFSKGDLVQQNYDKFNEYVGKRFFNKLEPFLISSKTSSEGKSMFQRIKCFFYQEIRIKR